MKCIQCGHDGLRTTTATHDVRIGDIAIRGVLPSETCPECKEVYIEGDALERLEIMIAADVARSGNVSGLSFRYMRKALGFQAKALGEIIGTPAETISRWETGASGRAVDRFAWMVLAGMVIDKAEERPPITHDIARATLEPKPLPRTVRLANDGR